MKRNVFCVALAIAGLIAAHSAQAVQSVFPASDAAGTPFAGGPGAGSVTKSGGQQLVFYGRYTSDNANESGLGLKIQFDSTKILGVTVDQVLTKCIVSFPPDQTVPGEVIFAWADTSVRADGAVGWTGSADGAPPIPGGVGCITLAGPPAGYVQTTAAVTPPTNLFRFTATTAAGFTSGSTTINLVSTGGGPFTATSLQVNGTPIGLLSASSRKSHGGTPFDIVLDPAGSMTAGQAITVEPRTIGTGYQVAFQFTGPVTSGAAASSSGSTSVAFVGNEAIVTLTGVADATRVQVDLTNVNGLGLNATARVGLLVGDVNGQRLVNSTDILTVKASSGAGASAGNFKSDLNANGQVNSTDILTVKASSGRTLP